MKTLNFVLRDPNEAADELDKLRERVAEMQYEAGMYQSLYELAQTKSNDAYERGFCAGYDVAKMQDAAPVEADADLPTHNDVRGILAAGQGGKVP